MPKHLPFLIVAVCAVASAALDWTQPPDYKLLDLEFKLLRLRSSHPPAPEVAVVGIDAETAQRLPEPIALWHKHLAQFLRAMALAGPAAVGIDIVLPDRSFEAVAPGSDNTLLRAIVEARRAYPLVLALTIEPNGRARRMYPPFAAAAGEDGIGYALWPVEADGMVRRFDERLGQDGSNVPTLTGQMLRRLNRVAAGGLIDFAQGASFNYVLLHQVLNWQSANDIDALKRAFSGKPVLLGVILPFTDRQSVPAPLLAAEPDSQLVPGVLLNAQVLRNALGRGLIHAVPALIVAVLAALAAALWFVPVRMTLAIALLAGVAIVLFALATWLLDAGWHLPIATPLLAAVLGLGGRTSYETLVQLRERRRLRLSFAGYVSPSVMDEIVGGRLQPDLGGTRRFVCVMFSDIRGYTTRSERMAPEQVIAFLNRYFERVVDLIHEHGGTVAGFAGDGIMAIFGAPDALERPCQSAFATAREMLAHADRLDEQVRAEGEVPLEIGIGLHAGDAVVGHVGSASRHDYSAIGDVTNVASRLEGLTKEVGYRLVCSQPVADGLSEPEALTPLGERAIKGHTPVEVLGFDKI